MSMALKGLFESCHSDSPTTYYIVSNEIDHLVGSSILQQNIRTWSRVRANRSQFSLVLSKHSWKMQRFLTITILSATAMSRLNVVETVQFAYCFSAVEVVNFPKNYRGSGTEGSSWKLSDLSTLLAKNILSPLSIRRNLQRLSMVMGRSMTINFSLVPTVQLGYLKPMLAGFTIKFSDSDLPGCSNSKALNSTFVSR